MPNPSHPLPLFISVPHAGLAVPLELADRCLLTAAEIAADGDEGAAPIYLPLAPHVAALETTDIARAVVDLNRAEDDRRKDGVVKTHTCWDVPVWRTPLDDDLVENLLGRYHRPYHRRIAARAAEDGVRLAIDAHTMAAVGPPVGPDTGTPRPAVCIGDGHGACPRPWAEALVNAFREALAAHGLGDERVTLNAPFAGGWITRSRPGGARWVQIELSRAPWASDETKSAVVLAALRGLCARLGWT